MDRMRGVYLPVLLLGMALLLGLLGNFSTEDGRALATRAQQLSQVDSSGLAPRAQAEARKRAMLKAAFAARSEGLTLFGGSGLLVAAAAILFLTHLRTFRSQGPELSTAGPGPSAGGRAA